MANSKIEIINNFDNMINRVDIDIDECLQMYNDDRVIGDLKCYKSFKKKEECKNLFEINKSYKTEPQWLEFAERIEEKCEKSEGKSNETNESPDDLEYDKIYKTADLWSEETKVVDYLNQVRMRTIEELREAQKEALENYKSQTNDSKFYFQVIFNRKRDEWIFKLFTFVTDFYISPDDISFLEKFINSTKYKNYLFVRDIKRNFDEKMILIGLFDKLFFENLNSEKFPSPVISVRKRDLLSIKQIYFYYYVKCFNLTDSSSIDLSNLESLDISNLLEKINIDGIYSLESLSLSLYSLKLLSIRNLPSLRRLNLHFENCRIDSKIQLELLDLLPSIEYLTLNVHYSHRMSDLSYFNLDSLVNLKSLSLTGKLNKDFNFDLFKNICNRLEDLSINLYDIDNKSLAKLFYAHRFPFIQTFSIYLPIETTKLEKNLFNGFPMLQSLSVNYNNIDRDAFSDLKQLISLDLGYNCIYSLDNMIFSCLINLKYLNLRGNEIKCIEANLFSNLKNLRVLDLSNNQLIILEPKAFNSLKNLKWLNLDNNRLVKFDLCILDYIKEIKVISALENPIVNKDEILARFKNLEIEFKF